MDGVSVAASLLSIGAIGCQVAIKLYTLAAQIGTASDRISSISKDVSFTSTILQQLGELIKQDAADNGTSIFSQVGLDTTRASAAICEALFNAIEQVAKDAREQIRRKGKVIGKIKLSKSEKAKWPFLQPAIDTLKNDLSEAKGTLMLMLQVTSLALSKKMTNIHQTATTHIVEQQELINAILEVSKRTEMKDNSGSNQLRMDPVCEVTTKSASKHSTSDEESPQLVRSLPNYAASSLTNYHVLATIPEETMPNPTTRGDNSEYMTGSSCSKDHGKTVEIDTISANTDSVVDTSISAGISCTPFESIVDVYSVGSGVLGLYLLKPVIQDRVDTIELSWNVHNILMAQDEIQKHIMTEQHEAVFELYRELYTHEHRAIEHAMAKARTNTTLKSLKRNKVDILHREISFQGVPSLEFVLERDAQRTANVPETTRKTEPKQPFVEAEFRRKYRKMELEDFLKDTSLGTWVDEMDAVPDPLLSKSRHGIEATEPTNLPFIGYSFPRFGDHGEPLQSHRQPFADVSTHQTSSSLNVESEKSYKSTVSHRASSSSQSVSSGKEDPGRPKLSRDRDQNEVFMDGDLFPTSMEDLDDMQQPPASKNVRSENSKAKPTEPRLRERGRDSTYSSPPRGVNYNPTGGESPPNMLALEDERIKSSTRAGRARHRVESKASSSMEPRQREASSDTRPAPSTLPIRKSVEVSEMTIAAADFNGRHPSDDGRTDVTDDSDDEIEDVSVEVIDEEEADMIVRTLLERYTTLFQCSDAPTKPGPLA